MKRNPLLFLVATVIGFVLVGCGGGDGTGTSDDGDAGETTRVNFVLNWIPGPQHAEVFIAREQGFFEDEGLDVNIHAPTQTTDAIKLVASGQDDMGMALFPDVILARAEGVPVIATAAFLDRKTDLGLLSQPANPISSPEDLVGKTVGLTPVPGNRARFFDMLEKNNISRDDVRVVTVQFDGPQRVSTGQVAAADAVSWFELGVYHDIAGDFPEYMPFGDFGVPSGYFVGTIVSERFAEENPEIVTKVTNAILEAQRWLLENPDEARAVLEQVLPEVSRTFIDQSRDILDEINVDDATADNGLGWMDEEVWQTMIDWSAEEDLIDSSFPAGEIFTNDYLGDRVDQP